MSTDKFPAGMRTVTREEWEAYMDRLDAGAIEPCDHWSIDECFCKGACGCHWRPEEEVCECQANWDFTFCCDGDEPDIEACSLMIPKKRNNAGVYLKDFDLDKMAFDPVDDDE
jgi:hypothetical protein